MGRETHADRVRHVSARFPRPGPALTQCILARAGRRRAASLESLALRSWHRSPGAGRMVCARQPRAVAVKTGGSVTGECVVTVGRQWRDAVSWGVCIRKSSRSILEEAVVTMQVWVGMLCAVCPGHHRRVTEA